MPLLLLSRGAEPSTRSPTRVHSRGPSQRFVHLPAPRTVPLATVSRFSMETAISGDQYGRGEPAGYRGCRPEINSRAERLGHKDRLHVFRARIGTKPVAC